MFTRRSMNSYMRLPRRVTMAPMAIPSRTLKAAMDFLARVTTGFCPVICPRSFASGSTFSLWPTRDGQEAGHTIIRLEMALGDSCSAIPPLMLRCGLGRTFFFTIITCSTRSFRSPGNTRNTRPCLPLSRPVITFTWSLRLMSTLVCISQPSRRRLQHLGLQHLRRQRHDLQELLFAQLAGHRPEHAGSHRLSGFIDEHGGILVKADIGAVAAAVLLALAHDHALDHGALFRRSVRGSLLDRRGHHVAQPPLQAGVPAP